jgi:hypothetical protein
MEIKMKFYKLTVAVACLLGSVSYNLVPNINDSIVDQTSGSIVLQPEGSWSISLNSAQAAVERIRVVGRRPPSNSGWGWGGWDETDYYDRYRDYDYGGGGGGGNNNQNSEPAEQTKKECLAKNSSVKAECITTAEASYASDLRRNCATKSNHIWGFNLFTLLKWERAYNDADNCQMISSADRATDLARCNSNDLNLAKLCPTG